MGQREKGTINPFLFQNLRKNYTIGEIAQKVGYTKSGLLRWCYRNGVDTGRITNWELEEEIRVKTPKEIAYEYNIKLGTVYLKLRKLGLNPKTQKGTK